MKRVLIDLVRSPALPHVYAGGNYLCAVRGLARIGAALARAGCGVTVLADPEFIRTEFARQALQDAPPCLAVIEAADTTAVPAALAQRRFDACVVWNGIETETTRCCGDAGVPVIFAEMGWFDPGGSVFLDPVGIMVSSSLAAFQPGPEPFEGARRAALEAIGKPAERRRLVDGDYLLLLLDAGSGWTYFDARHSDPLVIVQQLRARFPALPLAVRCHPAERDRVRHSLPPGAFDAGEGGLLDWAAHCTAAIGASSKAVFTPPLFGRPVVLIGRSVAFGPVPSPAFAQRHSIEAITDADITAQPHVAQADGFVHEALAHRHLSFSDAGPDALLRNRVLAPLLG